MNNLSRLCRVCASVIGQKSNKIFQVSKYITSLKSAFWIEGLENDSSEIHPPQFCSKCYHVMNNINKKKRTHSQTSLFVWKPHSDHCEVCIHSCQKERGGRRPKKHRDVINRFTNMNEVWTKQRTETLAKNTPEPNIEKTELNISDLDIKFNPSLSLCKCFLCDNIIKRPVMIEGCQHAFCLGCIVMKFEGKQLFECPYCHSKFTPNQVVPCKVRHDLIENLQMSCRCGELFHTNTEFKKHKIDCGAEKEGHMLTVNELLNLDLSEGTIPESVEKVTLRVLEHKIENSNTGTAEFASGGPRVILYYKILRTTLHNIIKVVLNFIYALIIC